MRLLFLLIPFFVMIPAYADSDNTPYQNSQFGYSISVPSGWIIDDQPFTSEHGEYDRLTSTAAIYDKPEWNHYIEISFVENDNLISNYLGTQYFEQVNSKLMENCNESSLESDGYHCNNYAVLGNKITAIDGKVAYQITYGWTEVYKDGTKTDFISIIIDIPMGQDVWNIEVYSIRDHFEEDQDQIFDIINSFEITEIQKQKIPGWVKDTMSWYVDGKISEDEMIQVLQYLIKEKIILVE
ncbi:MAG: hypothetical exported protein [Marine Group I thaumarchaeote]|nr:MAG: hypothetical exported protein [Marine Group I thaumarchaeote]